MYVSSSAEDSRAWLAEQITKPLQMVFDQMTEGGTVEFE